MAATDAALTIGKFQKDYRVFVQSVMCDKGNYQLNYYSAALLCTIVLMAVLNVNARGILGVYLGRPMIVCSNLADRLCGFAT